MRTELREPLQSWIWKQYYKFFQCIKTLVQVVYEHVTDQLHVIC